MIPGQWGPASAAVSPAQGETLVLYMLCMDEAAHVRNDRHIDIKQLASSHLIC